MTINVIKITTDIKPERRISVRGTIDYHHLLSTTLLNKNRDNLILDIIKQNIRSRILIITTLFDHAESLCNKLKNIGMACNFRSSMEKDQTVFIEMISHLREYDNFIGNNFDLVILACPIKDLDVLKRFKFLTITQFVDDDNIYRNQWYKCKEWYSKNNYKIIYPHIGTAQ